MAQLLCSFYTFKKNQNPMKKRKSIIITYGFSILLNLIMLIIISRSSSILQQNCLTHQVPSKFAILTTTYIRANSTKMINNYLQRYAESQCDIYDNIYIIWNNQQTPQQMGVLKNANKWKKNVYFMQTVQNSLDFKYIIPTWAKQKVFFGMDDDFDISCQTLKKAFISWQTNSYGQIGPLTSFYGRSFVFQAETQSFSYIDQIKLNKNWNYFHFGLTGIAFISRHFLQMYYSDIFQIKQMRKLVVQKNNCQDLLLNFMISYLYPELVTQYVDLPFKSLGTTGVSTTKTHRQYRAQCITKFSNILGFNPLRYVEAHKNQNLMKKKTSINENCLVNLKQQHFEKNFINNRSYYLYIKKITGVNNDFIKDQNAKLIEAKKDIEGFINKRKQQTSQLKSQQKMQIKTEQGLTQNEKKILQQVEMNIHFGSDQKIQSYLKNSNINQISPQVNIHITQKNQQIKPQSQIKKEQKIQKLVSVQSQSIPTQTSTQFMEYEYLIYLGIFSLIILLVFCIKKIIDAKSLNYQTVPVSVLNQL